MKEDQTTINDYFDPDQFTRSINEVSVVREKVNETFGNEKSVTVKPILDMLYKNALKNASTSSSRANRHDKTIKIFASSIFCLVGKSGYEFLQSNLGEALPSLSTISRMISDKVRMREGQFLFDELKIHLDLWNAPPFVHIHLDDTRVLNRVEYDLTTDRYVGLVLPIKDGLPEENAYISNTFGELQHIYNTVHVAKYAHCIVAKTICYDAPLFVFFVLSTDSKYDHIIQRWEFIEQELKKRGITVVTFGADGAGSFMKAMTVESGLFTLSDQINIKSYVMSSIKIGGIFAQDCVHLLVKLRTRLLVHSNLLALGNETACRTHVTNILTTFPKEEYGLTERIVSNKDKQNYTGITVLIGDGVLKCLKSVTDKMENNGTIIYIQLMRNIRDCFFDKSLSPSRRVHLIWKVVFFLRIWRRWLKDNGRSEKDHFVTNNAYVCVEINAHMMLQLIYNVINGVFPPEVLNGSQGCVFGMQVHRVACLE